MWASEAENNSVSPEEQWFSTEVDDFYAWYASQSSGYEVDGREEQDFRHRCRREDELLAGNQIRLLLKLQNQPLGSLPNIDRYLGKSVGGGVQRRKLSSIRDALESFASTDDLHSQLDLSIR